MRILTRLRLLGYLQLVNMGVGLLGFVLALIQLGSDQAPWGFFLLILSWGVNVTLLWWLGAIGREIR